MRPRPGPSALLLVGCLLLSLAAPAPARADDGDFDEPDRGEEPRRLSLTAWAGELSAISGSTRRNAEHVGGEVAWRFDAVQLGLLGQLARLRTGPEDWSPVVLLRVTEPFVSRRGLEGTFSFGIGAAREERWRTWFQVGLGVRLDLGPMFLAGEVGFEQADYVRFAAGLGTRF